MKKTNKIDKFNFIMKTYRHTQIIKVKPPESGDLYDVIIKCGVA